MTKDAATKDKETLARVQEGLFHLKKAIEPFVAKHMKAQHGERWIMYASRATGSGPLDPLDIYGLLKTIVDNWRDVFDAAFVRNEKAKIRTFVSLSLDARNTTSHLAVPLTDNETLRYLDAMVCLARAFKAEKPEIDALQKLYDAQRLDGLPPASAAAAAPPPEKPGALALGLEDGDKPAGPLRPWIEVAFPQPDVLGGRFKQSEFAADLAAVEMGRASDDYAQAENFFRITFLTEGLKRVLRSGLERLTGKGGDPVLGLQTSFGGGKTHTMLALYHLAAAKDLSLLAGVGDLAREAGITNWKAVKRVAFVGTAKGVDISLALNGKTKVRTLWGYIAWHLAGEAGLKLVQEAEDKATNPGSELMVELFKLSGPAVILLDEVVAFARQLQDDRFEAFLSFMQSLTEAAKMSPGILLVGSLPESDVEAGGEKGIEALKRLEKVFGRTGSPWLAAHGNETYEIVRRRLFQDLDAEGEKARDETVKAFHDLYKKNPAEFPAFAKDPSYAELLRIAYPIHPELFERLSKDWSTLEKFQKTRGVLRTMANIVSVMWSARTRDPLILPARVPIADERVKSSVIYPLDAAFSAVIDSEVDGDRSTPARMETTTGRRLSQARAATRAARAVFLCSAPTVGQPNAGVNGQGIRLAAAEPGDQLAIFGEALRELHEKATYLYEESGRYWFSTKPTLNRLIDDKAAGIPTHKIDEEITRILQAEGANRAKFAKVFAAPDDPAAIDEAPNLSLVILGVSATHAKNQSASPAIEAATDALTRCRTGQRRFRNTLIFVAPDVGQMETVRKVIAKSLAWAETKADPLVTGQLTTAQLADLNERTKLAAEASEKAVRAAWVHLLFAEKDAGVLDGRPFEVRQTSLLPRDRQSIVVSAFDKLSAKGDGIVKEELGPKMLVSKLAELWPADAPHLSVRDLKEWFASYVYLPKLRDSGVLLETIANGVQSTDPVFGYAESFDAETGAYTALAYRRQPFGQVSDNGLIVRADAAEAFERRAKQPGAAPSSPDSPTVGPSGGSTSTGGPATPAAPKRPTRFYGTVEIDMSRPVKGFEAILNAVVYELQRTPGAKVTLTLDVAAEAEAGFSEGDVGVVRDNARQLKFKTESTGFGE